MKNYKAKFMCSYGGEIQSRTDDNKLSYIGGNNRILYVHRNITFADMLAKLSALFNSADDVSFKYQFPGEGLDALISVADDDDLDNMMLEYDQLYRASATTARMRLFLFPNNPLSRTLNSGSTSAQPDPFKPNANVNFLFGLDNGAGVPLPPAAVKSLDLAPEPAAPPPEYQSRVAVSTSDRVVASDPNVNHLLEVHWQLQRVAGSASSSVSRVFDLLTPAPSSSSTLALPFRSSPDRMDVDAKLEAVQIDEDGIDDHDDYDDDQESEPNTVDYDDYDDEESEHNTLGFVDKPMNQWSLQSQFLPSKAGVPVYAPTEKKSTFHTPWGTSNHMAGCAASPSRLIGPLPATKYDVFISFRGEDTRTNFTCHLHEALDRKQIKTFIDYELHKGDEISPSLFRAIENACVSVVVFSENYASSKRCLEELVKILECREKQRQVVIPVFYDIDPSYVRKQNGSYKKAFENHLKNSVLNKKKVQIWKDALAEAADLAGWDSHSRSYRDDSELIQKIVEDVLQKLIYHYPPNDFKRLVGIQQNVAPLESLLREARSVGIWGIGGIGKTTIARYIFDKYSHQYEGFCFLENVRERSGDHGQGLHDLCDQLHSELLNEKIRQNSTSKSTFPKCRLYRQRNFIILDDVSSSMQLEYLLGELQSYGSNTKIIITTRDKSVLKNRRVETIYEMEGLGFQESFTLFNLSAFNEDSPEEYKELSRKAVAYCKGVPLALIVLGSFLHSKSEVEWDNALKKLEKIPHEEIQNVLKLSYDGLNYEEQQIFLDVACFFKGEPKENIVNLLDGCNFYPVIGMRSLLDKALITISNNFVWMHDLIQQMGWEIIRQESIKNPGNRSRLWDFDDTCDVLKNNKGSEAIQGIMLDMSQSRRDLCLSADMFKTMPNLRYLKLFISHWRGRFCVLQLPMGLESFSDKLRYLEWHAYPSQSLPSNFFHEKLVTLRMPHGQFKRLWSGVQNLVHLKDVNLAHCHELMELPDFSKMLNLKSLDLSFCGSLCHIHPSILSLGTLEVLHLFMCEKLETLESEIHFRSLHSLNVGCCSSLKKVSVSIEEMEVLHFTLDVKLSHLSIGRLSGIKNLYVDGSRLENLPEEWSYLKSLVRLILYNCNRVISKQTLHVIFDGLQSLQRLALWNCLGLFELPDNLNRLSSLEWLELGGSNVERLPESIKHLSRLENLFLGNCKRLQSLPALPSSISTLEAINCPMFPMIASSLTNSSPQEQERKSTSFQNGVILDAEKCIHSFYQSLREIAHNRAIFDENLRICYPDHKVPKWFTYRTKGASITFELDQPLNHYFSFLLCVVLSPYKPPAVEFVHIRYKCRLEDGRCFDCKDFLDHFENKMDWDFDHVCMSFDRGNILKHIKEDRVNQSPIKKRKRVNSQSSSYRCNPKITLEFYGYYNAFGKPQNNYWIIQECGVYPCSTLNMRLNSEGTAP